MLFGSYTATYKHYIEETIDFDDAQFALKPRHLWASLTSFCCEDGWGYR